jgi:sec-independent protein translocase protein TatC
LISALITPPDIISQIGLAIPVICLYEFSIFISKFFEKKKK